MPSKASLDTQHHTLHGESSRRKPSADALLQAEVDHLRADVAKMTESYDHLHTNNAELEHDCRTLKRNWENAHHQFTQQDLTQGVERTQLNHQFEEWETYPAPPNQHNKYSGLDAFPHTDSTMQLLFEKVCHLENEQHHSH
ncbi:hypothetical protein ACE6H2_011150 [Prunus campanulata]